MEPQTPPEDGSELTNLDVHEVSLVDRPAIGRRFSRTKAQAGQATTEGDPVSRRTIPAPPATATTTTAKADDTETVSKATGDLVSALVADYIDVGIEKMMALKAQVATGTLKRTDLWTAMDGVYSALYKVQDQLCVVAKSMGDDVEKAVVEKADKKMTARRLGELKGAIDALSKLCSELEAQMEVEDETKTETTKSEGGSAPSAPSPAVAEIAKAVAAEVSGTTADAVKKAVEPLETRLKSIEDRVEKLEAPPADQTETAKAVGGKDPKADPIADAVKKALTESLDPVVKRLNALESTPGTTPANKTEATEVEKGDKDLWSGIV